MQLDALRGKKPARPAVSAQAVAAVAVGAVAITGMLVFALLPRPVAVTIAQPPPPIPVPASEPIVAASTVAPVATEPPAKAPASPPRKTDARWMAHVTRADGLGLAAGAVCTIDATLFTADTNIVVTELKTQCGGQTVYDSADGLNGMSDSSNDAREVLGASDTKGSFTIQFRDLGTRTGKRTQIDLDSTKLQGSVFRETIPRFRVDFALQPGSLPTTPLADADHRLHRSGMVTRATGAATAKEGTPCTVRAIPTGKGDDCVAEVICAATTLWSVRAPVTCTYADGRPSGITSPDGPTILTLDDSGVSLKAKTYELGIDLTD